MKKILLAYLCLLPILSIGQTEKDSLLAADIDVLVEELEFMYGYDQTLREYILFKTFNKRETDSIETLADSLQRKILASRQFISDSLSNKIFRNYINPMDDLHTERLIQISRKYGFPSLKRIKRIYKKNFKDPEFNPMIIFIHAPESHWEELKELILQEREEGRINRCEYGYMLWHLNGRKSFQPMLDNGYELVELPNGGRSLDPVDCE